MIISVNRAIFRALSVDLQEVYVYEQVINETSERLSYSEEVEISKGILSIITKYEEYNETHGVTQLNGSRQVDETCLVPGFSEPSGYSQIGKFLIAPFDWSWDENGDFEYSFSLYYSMEYIQQRT